MDQCFSQFPDSIEALSNAGQYLFEDIENSPEFKPNVFKLFEKLPRMTMKVDNDKM
jgi:hypothetical protein